MTDIDPSGEGGCCSACAAGTKEREPAPAIACSLDADDYRARIAGIRELAKRSLRSSRREGLKLHLNYKRQALGEVEALVAREAKCCAFLDFAVTHDRHGVHLTVTAPVEALEAAEDLFAQFAPGHAGSSA